MQITTKHIRWRAFMDCQIESLSEKLILRYRVNRQVSGIKKRRIRKAKTIDLHLHAVLKRIRKAKAIELHLHADLNMKIEIMAVI